ncbi:MAG: ABC transporter substrate-binding protein, partial [Sphaerochaetaceae bacterium]
SEAVAYQAKIDDEDQENSLKQMKEQGVAVHELSDKNKWIEACKPMIEEYRLKGADWDDFINKITAIN